MKTTYNFVQGRRVKMTPQEIVATLKAKGEFEKAGKIARQNNLPRYFGCHVGMRSTYESSKESFLLGWDNRDEFERRSMLAGMPVAWGAIK